MNKPLLGFLGFITSLSFAACSPNAAPDTSAQSPQSTPKETQLTKTETVSIDKVEKPGDTGSDLANGRRQFAKCKVCHTLAEGGAHKVGPNLYGFYESPAAQAEGFRYSPALKKAELVWNQQSLERWLENPRKAVPGTTMSFVGVRDEKARRDLIAYLLQQTQSQP